MTRWAPSCSEPSGPRPTWNRSASSPCSAGGPVFRPARGQLRCSPPGSERPGRRPGALTAVAELLPLRGIRYDPEHVRLGGVLAPPYDVISPGRRDELYGRDLRNVVRVDFGQPYPGDVAGDNDVYTRAAEHLRSWCDLGILVRDERPGLYLVAHEFPTGAGELRRRLGLMGRVPAVPWERSEVRP